MNLVFIAPFAYWPKATVSARMQPMATSLVRHGHNVWVLIPPYDNVSESGKHWVQQGVRLENQRVRTGWPAFLLQANLALQIARRVRQLNPDLIHVFKPVGPGALAMSLLYAVNERRFVVDNDDWEGRGGWLDSNPYPPVQQRFMAWQERWCIQHARAVTCASDTLSARSVSLMTRPVPVKVLPNGADSSLRQQVTQAVARRAELRRQFGWEINEVAIYTGTVPAVHDLDIAVQAVARLSKTRPYLKLVIIASGDGLPSLQQIIHEAGIEGICEIHPFMPHARLVERLVAADIALYPYRDTNINRAKCSGKVVDYMAAGLPMVVSDVGMNRTYIEDGRSGMLTEPGNPDAFSQAMLRLLDEPSFAAQLGASAQQRLWQHFNWDDRGSELLEIYAGLHSSLARPASTTLSHLR
ncbi:MAG: glycosyltransferase family 4 protein [Chloroflexi bacterium]|nr:glycosyltransferase family 4 protein [Chloroflexota bacterium]MCL5274739.1 glycosyltransferase family 4 protein [Chloroflexota bacterium]